MDRLVLDVEVRHACSSSTCSRGVYCPWVYTIASLSCTLCKHSITTGHAIRTLTQWNHITQCTHTSHTHLQHALSHTLQLQGHKTAFNILIHLHCHAFNCHSCNNDNIIQPSSPSPVSKPTIQSHSVNEQSTSLEDDSLLQHTTDINTSRRASLYASLRNSTVFDTHEETTHINTQTQPPQVNKKQKKSSASGRLFEVIDEYDADTSDCLSLAVGDGVMVVDRLDNNGWWFGKKIRSESTGLFPIRVTSKRSSKSSQTVLESTDKTELMH